MTAEFQHNEKREEIDTTSSARVADTASSRRTFLRRSAAGIALAAPLGALAVTHVVSAHGTATPQKSPAKSTFAMPSWTDASNLFYEIQSDEKEHIQFLINLLHQAGGTPRPRPTFKNLWQGNVSSFVSLSAQLKSLSVDGYLLLASRLQNKSYQTAISSLLGVEARHAGYLNSLLRRPLSQGGAFEKACSQVTITQTVAPFIDSLRGGQDIAIALNDDKTVLNYALMLEYLEVELYNQNLPTYFS